jgi:hypothetical protein
MVIVVDRSVDWSAYIDVSWVWCAKLDTQLFDEVEELILIGSLQFDDIMPFDEFCLRATPAIGSPQRATQHDTK